MRSHKITIIVFLFVSVSLFAQDKNVITPSPKGGLKALMHNVVYPEQAGKSGVQGVVVVKATIDETGKVVSAEVVKSLSKECDQAAVDAVRKTEFTAGRAGGKPAKTEAVIPISFKLK